MSSCAITCRLGHRARIGSKDTIADAMVDVDAIVDAMFDVDAMVDATVEERRR